MASSRLIELFALALACTAASTWSAAAERATQTQAPISLEASNYATDFRTGKTVLSNVKISQGDVSITADTANATGIDFKDSRWEFMGKVHIVAESRGTLQSDKAIVEFRDNRIKRATVTGTPAQFEQKRDANTEAARGRAGEIIYEVEAGTVRFAREAWLSNGSTEVSGSLLVYNIRQQKVEGTTSGDGQQRVKITITPDKSGKVVVKPQSPAQPEGSTTP